MKGVLRCIWLVNQCLARNEWIGASSVRSEIFLPLMQLKFTVRSNKTGFKLWFLTVRGLNLDCRFLFSKSRDLELSFFLKRFPLTFIEAYEFFSAEEQHCNYLYASSIWLFSPSSVWSPDSSSRGNNGELRRHLQNNRIETLCDKSREIMFLFMPTRWNCWKFFSVGGRWLWAENSVSLMPLSVRSPTLMERISNFHMISGGILYGKG